MDNRAIYHYHASMIEKLGVFYDEEVQRLIDSFACCFKVRFTVFTADCEDLTWAKPYDLSSYCSAIRERLQMAHLCVKENRAACAKCVKLQQPLVYRCHAGCHEVVMPIRVENTLAGYAMIGQFRSEAEAPPQFVKTASQAGADEKLLRDAWREMPFYDAAAIQDMVNLFSVLINFIVMREFVVLHQADLAERVSRWLDGSLARAVTLDDAAAAVCRSRSTVAHVIKRRFGVSFKQLLLARRVVRFETLLAKKPGLTISEAASCVGYSDPLYFSRVYKKYRRVSPTAYARSIKPPLP